MCHKQKIEEMNTHPHTHTHSLTFDGEGFPDSCQFTVCIDGNFVVEQSFVHDEGVKLRRICPSTQSNAVTTATEHSNGQLLPEQQQLIRRSSAGVWPLVLVCSGLVFPVTARDHC